MDALTRTRVQAHEAREVRLEMNDGSFILAPGKIVAEHLAVHKRINRDTYTITHLPTGMNFMSAGCQFEHEEDAVAAAEKIAAVTDWSKPRSELLKVKGLSPMVASIAARHNGARA